jgi:CHAD domain-containing protein
VLGHLTDILLSLAPVVAEAATGAEPVHQMRVAVRRARSALSIFRPVMDYPDFARIVLGVKHLGQTLGPARDWDVFMTETAPPVEAEFPGQASLAALLKAGARRRVAARTALIAYLGGAEFRLLCLDLACLAAATPGDEEAPPLADFAASVLSTNWKKLIKSARSLGKLDHGAMHATRLKAKRLRYAAEFFAPLFADKPAARFIRRLAELQERLGIFNDAAGVEDLLRELSGGAGHAGGLVLGFTAAKGAGTRPKIVMAWDRLRRRGPFWV